MTYTLRKATNILSYFLLSSKTLNDSLKNAQNRTETLKIDTETLFTSPLKPITRENHADPQKTHPYPKKFKP